MILRNDFGARTADMMEAMRKPWVYKRKGIPGWWCGWYEGGKRKAKALPTKALAEHFRHIKYTQLAYNLARVQEAAPKEGSLWMPPPVSTVAGHVDWLFYFILGVSTFFFLLIVALMVLEHQAEMHNLITRTNYDARLAIRDAAIMNKMLGQPEQALTPSTRLGGHLVSGHVDGVGEVIERKADARSERFRIRAPRELARYIAHKGSICVDGVSLTVNAVEGNVFDLNIVPHTLTETTLDAYRPGRKVNLEVDLIFFDTTSTYFERDEEDGLRQYGHSKDHREDLPQIVIGLAVTKEGIPVTDPAGGFLKDRAGKIVVSRLAEEALRQSVSQLQAAASGVTSCR